MKWLPGPWGSGPTAQVHTLRQGLVTGFVLASEQDRAAPGGPGPVFCALASLWFLGSCPTVSGLSACPVYRPTCLMGMSGLPAFPVQGLALMVTVFACSIFSLPIALPQPLPSAHPKFALPNKLLVGVGIINATKLNPEPLSAYFTQTEDQGRKNANSWRGRI